MELHNHGHMSSSVSPLLNIAYIENTMLVSFDISFIRRDENSVGMARLAEPVRRVSG